MLTAKAWSSIINLMVGCKDFAGFPFGIST
jgi:hypothetical protein